jgi:sterol desaturase/sphingolipid hydroxylase (fatty acid hydroxylase superfamily)
MEAFLGDAYSAAYGLVNSALIRLQYPAATCLIYLLFELLLPRTRNSPRSYWRAAYFTAAAIVINTILLALIEAILGISQRTGGIVGENQVHPLTILDLTPLTTSEQMPVQVAGWAAATLGVAMVVNFFYYWMHRAQHVVPWLWRFHRVHHSITEMSATASYHHFAEDLFQFVAVTLPTAFLLSVVQGPVPWLVIVAVNTHTYFIHSSARFNIGPLRYVICDNRYHRIHHSVEPHHINHNFATSTPLWDVLFGTAYFPKAEEWPKVGLAGVAEPRSFWDFVLSPFRSTSGRSRRPVEEH